MTCISSKVDKQVPRLANVAFSHCCTTIAGFASEADHTDLKCILMTFIESTQPVLNMHIKTFDRKYSLNKMKLTCSILKSMHRLKYDGQYGNLI